MDTSLILAGVIFGSIGTAYFIPLEKTTDFNRWCRDFQADGGLIPPSA